MTSSAPFSARGFAVIWFMLANTASLASFGTQIGVMVAPAPSCKPTIAQGAILALLVAIMLALPHSHLYGICAVALSSKYLVSADNMLNSLSVRDSHCTSTFDMSSTETPWEGNDGMDLQMLTEIMDSSKVDEVAPNRSSLEPGLKFILTVPSCTRSADARTHQPRDLKWLLEQTQTASATWLHAPRLSCVSCVPRWSRSTPLHQRLERRACAVRGRPRNFNDEDVHTAVRGLMMGDWLRLLLGLAWPTINTVTPASVLMPVVNIIQQGIVLGTLSMTLDNGDSHFHTFGGIAAARVGIKEAE
ncbi:hypothetical protein JB92DRAFT_2826992 [Gautieria morchelliformis]|nr:hypothetical protein JB92DRAFT_2826992 [Gautieria morchelliformis]